MTTKAISYATRTAFTITLASLGNGSYRESTAKDNTANLYVDSIIDGKITVGTTPTANTTITIFVWGTGPSGDKPGAVTGTDAAYSAGQTAALGVGAVLVVPAATSNVAYPFSFGLVQTLGFMPASWGVVVLNSSGVALNATAGNHEVFETGIKYTDA